MNEELNAQQNNQTDLTDNQSLNEENINLDALKTGTSEAKILELESKVAELTDKFYRANADFENLKKRVEKEKADIASYANEKFARDLLPVIDAMQMGASFEPDSDDEFAKKIKEGFDITISQFQKCFEKHGISEIKTDGNFDPNIHNAVLSVDSEAHESGQIVQVMQKGYMINDRVLRPAMVSIAK